VYPSRQKLRGDHRMIVPNKHTKKEYQLLLVLLALALATIFTVLPIDVFKDRVNYFFYAENSYDILIKNFNESFLNGVLGEPLWLIVNALLGAFLGPENVVRIIIFIPTFITMHFIFKAKPKYTLLLLFFLLNNTSLTNHIHHLRFSFAVSLMLLAFMLDSKTIRFFLLSLTPFIHAGFFVLTPIYIASQLAVKYKHNIFILVLLASLGLVFLLVGFLYFGSEFSGPRQVDRYTQFDASVGGGAFLMWSCILVLFISQGYAFCERHLFPILVIVLYLNLYFFMPGVKRFLEGVIWLIILAAFTLSRFRRWAFIGAYGSYTALELYFKWKLPWFGLADDQFLRF